MAEAREAFNRELATKDAIVDASGRRVDFEPQRFTPSARLARPLKRRDKPSRAASPPSQPASCPSWPELATPLLSALDWPIVLAQPPLPFEIARSD